MTAVLEHSFVHVPIGFKGVEASEEEVDVSVLKSALDRMQAEMKKKTFAEEQRQRDFDELHEEKSRILALRDTLRALTGVEVREVTQSDKGHIKFLVDIKACSVEISLDQKKRLSDIKVLSKDFFWIDAKQVVAEGQQLGAPNDLRCAVHRIAVMQQP